MERPIGRPQTHPPESREGRHRSPAARRRTSGVVSCQQSDDGVLSTVPRPQRPAPSHLLQINEKNLELKRPRARISDKRRERVGQPVPTVARVTVSGYADVAPMDGDADLKYLLTGDRHRAEALGNHSQDLDLAAF